MRATDGSGLRKRQRGFAAVPNETVFAEPPLSARALGVLTKVVALPVDWDLRMDWLIRQFPEGRDAIQTAVRELRARGFYRVERRRRDDGTFTSGVSVSDVTVPEWADQHRAACTGQDTDRPRWDVSLRLLADGRVEDEPSTPGPTSDDTEPPPTEATDSDGPDTETVNGFPVNGSPVTGSPVTGKPVTGFPAVKDRHTTQTDTDSGHPGEVRDVSSGPARGTPPTPSSPPTPAAPAGGAAMATPDGVPLSVAWPRPPDRCPTHLAWPRDRPVPPCTPCGRARQDAEEWDTRTAADERAWQLAREHAERVTARQARADTDAERAACRLCDDDGFVSVGEDRLRCRHDRPPVKGRAEWQATRQRLATRPRRA